MVFGLCSFLPSVPFGAPFVPLVFLDVINGCGDFNIQERYMRTLFYDHPLPIPPLRSFGAYVRLIYFLLRFAFLHL